MEERLIELERAHVALEKKVQQLRSDFEKHSGEADFNYDVSVNQMKTVEEDVDRLNAVISDLLIEKAKLLDFEEGFHVECIHKSSTTSSDSAMDSD